jgi:hypothetical protein
VVRLVADETENVLSSGSDAMRHYTNAAIWRRIRAEAPARSCVHARCKVCLIGARDKGRILE